ncbi:MFS general substrate transporter [Exidia glandulosa HHB12029]|uniref:MFS general substrate transporter n=1 Tax=Exidia glandulosa HHB12029 TaxID=1314781 RepID=A0A165B1S8_EXIGL|nr:MFS general substrate transporter [Exidia glandulosa HHB12029]
MGGLEAIVAPSGYGGRKVKPEAMQVQPASPIESNRARYYAFALVTSLFFTWGFAYGLLDVLNKHFQSIFNISHTQTTLMQVAYFGAYFVFAIPAGQFSSRFGYKRLIYVGLSLYALGAFMFWPSAVTKKYYGFVLSTVVIGAGLVSLEVAANSYISVLGPPHQAAMRLTFAQARTDAFQAVAAFTGPLIASRAFFHGENQNNLHTVQYVYLGVGLLGICLIVLFFFCKLPEITEAQLQENLEATGAEVKPLWKQWHTLFGAFTQFCYVGAQVALASFVLFYITEDPYLKTRFTSSEASNMFSYMQITFMLGRFVSTPLLQYMEPDLQLLIWGGMTAIFSLVAALTGGRAGLASLFIVFFFESSQFPIIFCLGTSNLGKWTKRGSSLLVMGVGGGAAFPPAQGAVADSINSVRSYIIPFIGYMVVVVYSSGMIIARKRATARAAALIDAEGGVRAADDKDRSSVSDSEKKVEDERRENVTSSAVPV